MIATDSPTMADSAPPEGGGVQDAVEPRTEDEPPDDDRHGPQQDASGDEEDDAGHLEPVGHHLRADAQGDDGRDQREQRGRSFGCHRRWNGGPS
jgi:hypothetical protein